MNEENNNPANLNTSQNVVKPEENKIKKAGNMTQAAGKTTKAAGTTMQAAGKTARVAGTGMNVAGKGVKYAGKGVSAAGQGMTKAGASLSSTGLGAIVGAPLAALGAATTAVGKGAEVAGSAAEKAGQATNKAGKAADEAGKKTKDTGKKLDSSGKNTKGPSSVIGKVSGLKKIKSLKFKLILIGIGSGLIFIVIFLIVLITPLMTLGIIEIGDITGGGDSSENGYSDITSNSSYWWPIGSSETEIINGKEFAKGDPTSTYISCGYGNVCYNGHTGIDIGNLGYGSNYHNVIAALDGTVEKVNDGVADGTGTSYGNYVKIKHNDGNYTIYGHMYINSIKVSVGDSVKQGQVIGKMGSSGNSSGPHLHFEIRVNGSAADPQNFVSTSNPRPSTPKGNYVSGDSNKQSICLTLKENNFSQNGIIALLTNINSESSFDYTSYNPDDNGGPSYGLCQWHNERYTNLRTTFPNEYQTIEGQINFLIYELDNDYSVLSSNLVNGSKSAEDLTYDFCYNFEVPADTKNTCSKRANNSVNFEDYVRNGCQ